MLLIGPARRWMFLAFVLVAFGFAAWGECGTVLWFDMGTAGSPVATGFKRVTADDAYSPDAGFGWVGTGYESVLTEPPTGKQNPGIMQESDWYPRVAGPLTVDHVKNPGDMTFKADVPPGSYRVILYLGDLRQPLGSMTVYANGELVRKNVQSKQWAARGGGQGAYGNSFPVRFSVAVKGGPLEISVKGDDSDYNRWLEEDSRKPPTESFIAGKGGTKYNNDLEKYQKGLPLGARSDLGHPFVYNSIQGIEICPLSPAPLSYENGVLAAPGASPALAEAVQLFNEKKFNDAIDAFNRLPDLKARILGLLYVLGSPDYDVPDGDVNLISTFEPLIEHGQASNPDDPTLVEAEMTFDLFKEALRLISERGRTGNAYNMCIVAASGLEKLQPDDPLYYKGMLYRARAYYMVDPHRWGEAAGTAKKIMEEVEKAFPRNRYVRLYLYTEWAEAYDWHLKDYMADAGDAPEWAASLRDANNLLLDLSEWWILNKQQPDGQIGGGWGDDVELVGLFGFYASVSKHISDIALNGASKLVDGAWNHSEIDTEAGFFEGTADAEHSSEFTGDTLPMMLIIDYGNPIWLERAMKTGKLLRDLWSAKNAHGYRSFRSNHVGAFMVGGGKTAANSAICMRAVGPLYKVYDYNHSPALEKLFIELADGWLDAALQTGKEKPKGIIPTNVSFPDVEMGGPGAPTWFDPGEIPWRQFFLWPTYRAYQVELLVWAYQTTGDEKYLEPFMLASEFLAANQPDANAAQGSAGWISANLQKDEGIRYISELAAAQKTDVSGAKGKRDGIISSSKRVHDILRAQWPLKTTDSLATDRVAFSGIISAYFTLTGGELAGGVASVGSIRPSVTYENTGRDFAAYVPVAEPKALKVVIYLFGEGEKKIGFCPWVLEPGAEYELRSGPDKDGDDRMDSVARRDAFTLNTRGEPIYMQVPGRESYIIEIEQTKPGVGAKTLLPDLAVVPAELEYNALRRILIAKVHNVGAAPVENSSLSFYDGDPEQGGVRIGSAVIPHIPAPEDFDPRTLRLGVTWTPSEPEHDIYVVLDPGAELTEISKANNVAHARMSFQVSLQAQPAQTEAQPQGRRR